MTDEEVKDIVSRAEERVKREKVDPWEDLRYEPEEDCPHGNGSNCECQLPRYRGLFVLPIETDEKVRHVIGRMRQAYDGGMLEFRDPESNEVVGCCGVNWGRKGNVKHIMDFIDDSGYYEES